MKKTDHLKLNSPTLEPRQVREHLRNTRKFVLQNGRRPTRYVVAAESSKAFDEAGPIIQIEWVNTLRPRMARWPDQGYPRVTVITEIPKPIYLLINQYHDQNHSSR